MTIERGVQETQALSGKPVYTDLWDMRRRMQWCMTPLGANMLAADAIEYAELELYLTQFDNGKPLNVPGIRH